MFTTFCYAQCNDSLKIHWIYNLQKIYQQYKFAPITHKLWFIQHMLHIWSNVWMQRHISQPTIFLFFKKLTGPGCLLVTSILWNIWCTFSLLSGGSSFSFYVQKSTIRPIFSTWINGETTVNSPNDSLISTLPSTESCEMTKCFALVLLFNFMSMKSENVINFFCYRGH